MHEAGVSAQTYAIEARARVPRRYVGSRRLKIRRLTNVNVSLAVGFALLLGPGSVDSLVAQTTPEWLTLSELAAGLRESYDVPGVALARARPGQEPDVGVAGVRWIDGGPPLMVDDRFHLGSLTKSITATMIARLVERGSLAWSDRIGALLPKIDMHPAYTDLELQQLLRHRGRVAPDLQKSPEEIARLNDLPGNETEQREAYVREVLRRPPGPIGFAYSNAGYAVAGLIAERAGGSSWSELVMSEVFEPLHLSTCGFGWPATTSAPDQPRGHYGVDDDLRVQPLDEFELGAFIGPAGNTKCAVADLARYGLAHLEGLLGQDGYLKSETVLELHRVDDVPYAAGWGVDPVSGQHRHDGSVGPFYAYLTIDPEAQVVVAVATNVGPERGRMLARDAAAAILAREGS